MSSYSRRYLLGLPVVGLLAACGFTPVYGPEGNAEALRGTIEVKAPSNTNSYNFVKHFEERMGVGAGARYSLNYSISTKTDGVAITQSQETTRYNVIGEATYTLTEIGTGKKLASGKVQSFTSYGSTDFVISTRTSRDDAYRRLMVILADDIIDQLLANPEITAP
ncbi:LPS assembly lipoprotein LptE [Halocynthiibacter sp. C4]|uniref:LPS assembly lipoprotein LptE n=1 Tax=Halocynthiibacter sp. C4 TaxID=2992758 RepID=UPI00237AFE89|nr:LPS assembly lipoprotein LptE [Halocynthiibacter sp. C4]MDE0591072.1 LPS assembly lipoprotein LptE [Halocynthiibacter sp. C4]